MTILKEGKRLTPTQVAKLQIQDALFERLDNVEGRIENDLDGSPFADIYQEGETQKWTDTEMRLCQEAYVKQMNRVLKIMTIEKDSYPVVES
jgi:hypothetical protein